MAGSGVIILNGIGNPDGPHTIEFDDEPPTASDIMYDNTTSHLTATTMQEAIDQVNTKVTDAGLININDIEFTVSGWNDRLDIPITQQFRPKVVNGVLCGHLAFSTTTPSTISLSCNYNIPQEEYIGTGWFSGPTTIAMDVIAIEHPIANTTFTQFYVVFSSKWNPSWTKKEST